MGCSSSKETGVPTPPISAASSNNINGIKATQQPPPPPPPPKPVQAPSVRGSTPSEAPPASPPSPKIENKAFDETPAIRMIQLNDVEELPHNGTSGPQRGRFLSYASGASTPNTSSNDLVSLADGYESTRSDGSLNSGDGGDGGGGLDSPTRKSRNPKQLKHSGSAIGLDEIHSADAGLTQKVVHIEVPFGKPIEEVYDGVHSGPVLGSGVSGLVRLVTHKATGLEYAVKCLDLGLVGTKEGLAQLREEIFIMCQLDHPNIVRLEEVYESHSEIYLVQELCVGGELFDRLDEQPDYHYTESECARLVKQMLSAVRYLHSKGIIHRDLKLENFLFSSKNSDSELKMIDFGLSKHFRYGEVHHEAVGTPYTVAPEVIKGCYDERCDIWAIGVIAFLLLSGDPPFGGCGGPEPLLTVRANILSGKYEFEPEDIWDLVSQNGKNFVRAMLVLNPKERPTAREAQKHSWLKEWASRTSKRTDTVLNPNVVKALVNFKEYSHFRKLLSEVLSFTLLPEQIVELRKEFELLDTDGSGEISLKALKEVLLKKGGSGSLGALNEDEVEDIFNAMRVNKAETRIHWHEFIAAGLSQCQVDDRNLRLAFDRLDSDHKGFITLDDIMNLVGSEETNEEQMRAMWSESMKSVGCTQQHISYDQFVLLMKGQTVEPAPQPPGLATTPHRSSKERLLLLAVPEGDQVDSPAEMKVDHDGIVKKPNVTIGTHLTSTEFLVEKKDDDVSLHSLPNLGGTPSMGDSASFTMGLGSPGSSPAVGKEITEIDAAETPNVPMPAKAVLGRARSKSLSVENENEDETPSTELKPRIVKRGVSNDSLQVKRTLYQAHRQMRLSVLDASRRFEEQQARRARDTLIAEKEAADARSGLVPKAGLVMRHGQRVQVTSEAIRQYLEKNNAEQQNAVEKANRRGGRGRHARKKTISDMSAMMTPSMGEDELGTVATTQTPEIKRTIRTDYEQFASIDLPDLGKKPPKPESAKPVVAPKSPPDAPSIEIIDKTLRKATVPGQFRNTHDPFSAAGMYGGSRMSNVDVHTIKGGSTKEFSKNN